MEDGNAELRDLADDQALRLEALTRRFAELEDNKRAGEAAGIVGAADADDANSHEQGDNIGRGWRPPRHRPGMPDAGVGILKEQLDEEHVFGPAAELVAEWRGLRTGGNRTVGRVERAQVAVRRWQLEAKLLGEYRLTLPPDTYPLDEERLGDHLRWRRDALAESRRELRRARRARLLRRVLGLWRR